MDMYDVLYSTYFTSEWGSALDENDKTFDTEYTPQAAQVISTLVGIKPISDTQIEVYVNYWHFDEAEIADWASMWSSMPWEIYASMEKSVLEGKVSFSRSGAVSKNISWLSLIIPNDSQTIKKVLEEFREKEFIPNSLKYFNISDKYAQDRYDSSITWIDENNHAVISNGPFYLKSYSPESRTITIASFDDKTYPFQKGHWSEFENVDFPKITNIDIPTTVTKNDALNVTIETQNTSEIRYFISNSNEMTDSNSIQVNNNKTTLNISKEVIRDGTNNIKIFAISEKVQRPDFYSSSFIVSENLDEIKILEDKILEEPQGKENYLGLIFIIIIIVALVLLYRKKQIK